MLLVDLLAHDSTVQPLQRGATAEVRRLAVPNELRPQTLAFVKNTKFLTILEAHLDQGPQREAGVVFDEKLWEKTAPEKQTALKSRLGHVLVSPNIPLTITRLSAPLHREIYAPLQSAVDGRQMGTAKVHPGALIAQGVFLGEHTVVGEGAILHPGVVVMPHVQIGAGCELFPQVTLYPFTTLGARVRVHAGTVIGADGFGYVFHQGKHEKIWHMGGVEIHDDVEIGACSAIDQGAFTPTVIGAGSRLDNHVQVGHNCKLGKGCILCGHAGLSGSVVLEDYVVMGGKSGVGPDAYIGKGTQIAGAALVNEGAVWPAGSQLGGHPARDLKEWMRTFAWLRKNALKG